MVNCRTYKILLSPLPPPTTHSLSHLTRYPRVRLGQVHPLRGRLLHPPSPVRYLALAYRIAR
jgi:hypothetical protein